MSTIAIVGHGSAGLAAALMATLEHDTDDIGTIDEAMGVLRLEVSERRYSIVCDPRPGSYERGGKRGSADWKQHTNRRGKRRNWG
jgi:hypothetical protein